MASADRGSDCSVTCAESIHGGVSRKKKRLELCGVYKVYVNGAEFGRYKERGTIDQIMGAIKKFIHTNQNAYYEMPDGDYKDGDA